MGLRHFLLSSRELQYFSSGFISYNRYLFKCVAHKAFLHPRCIYAMPVVKHQELDVRCIKSSKPKIKLIICCKSFSSFSVSYLSDTTPNIYYRKFYEFTFGTFFFQAQFIKIPLSSSPEYVQILNNYYIPSISRVPIVHILGTEVISY